MLRNLPCPWKSKFESSGFIIIQKKDHVLAYWCAHFQQCQHWSCGLLHLKYVVWKRNGIEHWSRNVGKPSPHLSPANPCQLSAQLHLSTERCRQSNLLHISSSARTKLKSPPLSRSLFPSSLSSLSSSINQASLKSIRNKTSSLAAKLSLGALSLQLSNSPDKHGTLPQDPKPLKSCSGQLTQPPIDPTSEASLNLRQDTTSVSEKNTGCSHKLAFFSARKRLSAKSMVKPSWEA